MASAITCVGLPSTNGGIDLQRIQLDPVPAIDMFVVASASFRLLYVMIILTHDRRKIARFDVIRNPTTSWLARQVTEAVPWDPR
jgi:hypothetical protein